MLDMDKILRGWDRCSKCLYPSVFDQQFKDCEYTMGMYCRKDKLISETVKLLKEQEKLVDVDALREKLGLAKDCAKCKQNTRACQYDSHFSLMDFCERFDMAIEELMQEGR